jgi:hypothetical protein
MKKVDLVKSIEIDDENKMIHPITASINDLDGQFNQKISGYDFKQSGNIFQRGTASMLLEDEYNDTMEVMQSD